MSATSLGPGMRLAVQPGTLVRQLRGGGGVARSQGLGRSTAVHRSIQYGPREGADQVHEVDGNAEQGEAKRGLGRVGGVARWHKVGLCAPGDMVRLSHTKLQPAHYFAAAAASHVLIYRRRCCSPSSRRSLLFLCLMVA